MNASAREMFNADAQATGRLWRSAKDAATDRIEQAANASKYDFEFLMDIFVETIEDGTDIIDAADEIYDIAMEEDF